MTTLLIAEHDNKSLRDATNKALTAAKAIGRRRARAGRRQGLPSPRRRPPPSSTASPRCCWRTAPAYEHQLAEPLAALIVSLAGNYDAHRRAGDHRRQELDAACRGAARRDADLRNHQGDRARHVRAADLCRQRHPDGEVVGSEEGHHRAHLDLPGGGRGRLGADRDHATRPTIRRCRLSSARSCRSPTGRS